MRGAARPAPGSDAPPAQLLEVLARRRGLGGLLAVLTELAELALPPLPLPGPGAGPWPACARRRRSCARRGRGVSDALAEGGRGHKASWSSPGVSAQQQVSASSPIAANGFASRCTCVRKRHSARCSREQSHRRQVHLGEQRPSRKGHLCEQKTYTRPQLLASPVCLFYSSLF